MRAKYLFSSVVSTYCLIASSCLHNCTTDNRQEVISQVSTIWCMWIRGTPVQYLVPLLREGSTSVTTTGMCESVWACVSLCGYV